MKRFLQLAAKGAESSGKDCDGVPMPLPADPTPITIALTQRASDAVDVFDELFDELEALGFDPHVQLPRNGEYSQGGIVIDELVAVSVFVGALVVGPAKAALEEALGAFFSRKFNDALGNRADDEPDPEIVRIYGPNRNEILSEVEVRPEPPRRRSATTRRKKRR